MQYEKDHDMIASSDADRRANRKEPLSPSKRPYSGSVVRVERTISFIMDKDAQLDIAMREASKKLERNRK